MRPNRAILMFSVLVIALQGAGALRTLHNLSHHIQPSITQSCDHAADQNTPKNQAPKAPSNQPSDKDCHLCLSLHSITPTLSDPAPLPLPLPAIAQQPARPLAAVPALYILSDHPTRGPPLS